MNENNFLLYKKAFLRYKPSAITRRIRFTYVLLIIKHSLASAISDNLITEKKRNVFPSNKFVLSLIALRDTITE